MEERLNDTLSREKILNSINRSQNEILSNDNRITRIISDPFIHTGSQNFTDAGANTIGLFTYTVVETIPLDTPTKGFLLITDTTTDQVEYVSYSGSVFTLADNVSLPRTYNSTATSVVDDLNIIASGAIFNASPNMTTLQYDIRRVDRVYAFRSKTGGWPGGYGRWGSFSTNNSSFRPDRLMNLNSDEIEVSCDTAESLEPLSNDCRITMWRENTPGHTTDVYMARAQRWPAQVLTEDVPLTIPDRWQTNLLAYAILRDVEYTEYGRNTVPEEMYQKYLKDFLTWAESGSDSTTTTRTLPKDF
jgi:hypothetical protein